MEISSHLCQWVSRKTKPNDGSFLTCLTPPDPDTSFPTLSEETANQMTAVEIKEDKRMKLLNWGCSGVSRGGWLGLEHFHCTSESNREYRANSRCLLPRFSRSYRFKQKLHVSALRPVSGDKEEEQDENEAGDLIISGGNALFFMPASNPSLCH